MFTCHLIRDFCTTTVLVNYLKNLLINIKIKVNLFFSIGQTEFMFKSTDYKENKNGGV